MSQMKTEAQTIQFIQSLKSSELTSEELSEALFKNGHTNAKSEPFSSAQINSLLHSVNEAKRKAAREYLDKCGIDREANPCGDASDY
jgi:hypothetical protein